MARRKKQPKDFAVGQLVQEKRKGQHGIVLSVRVESNGEVMYMVRMQDGLNWLLATSAIQEANSEVSNKKRS